MAAKAKLPVPNTLEDVTPRWLTERLHDCGALASGAVTAVAAQVGAKWNTATTARLTLDFDSDPGPTPRSLFIKLSKPNDPLADIFPGEIVFYSEVRPDGLPLARCYGADFDPASGSAFVLLEDLSGTHSQMRWPRSPSLAKCEAAVKALARLHSYWWNAAPSAAEQADLNRNYARLAAHTQTLLPAFFDSLGDALSPARRALMERVLECIPALHKARLSEGRPVTRVHGDPHFWNILFPKDPERHDCVFVDWEDWRDDVPAGDLVYTLAFYWDRERRRRHEKRMLRAYHEALGALLPFDDLLEDYRHGHLQNFVVPVYQFHMGLDAETRLLQLERLFETFEDLDCGALL